MAPTVTAIVPSWNGRELLDVVVPSLERQTFDDLEIVVVDNGSTDGTAAHVREHWPHVKLIELGENAGFAAAVNRAARESDAEFVAVLNNDLELEPDWLAEMVVALRAHPDAASATGKMLDYERRTVIDDAGDQTSWYGASVPRGRGEEDRGQYDEPEPIFSACAGAALYRAAAFRELGGFDERFFAYAEDVDLGFRAQLAGYTCRYVPAARSYHMGQATSDRVPLLSRYLFWRNTLLLVAKNWPAAAFARHGHRLALLVAKNLVASIRGGWFPALARGTLDAFKRMPDALRARREIQRRRRVGLDYLDTVVLTDYPLESRILNSLDARLRAGR